MSEKLTDFNIVFIPETDSTNKYVKNLGNKAGDNLLVYTHFQTKGRGQAENLWESDYAKNILMTLKFEHVNILASEQFLISKIISLSIIELLAEYLDPARLKIKWPNDIYYDESKIAGILIENAICSDKISQSICGIGVNINQDRFFSNATNPVSLIQIIKDEISEHSMEEMIFQLTENVFDKIKKADKEVIDRQYRKRLLFINKLKKYEINGEEFLAKIKGVDNFGRLMIEVKGENKFLNHGEIKFIFNNN